MPVHGSREAALDTLKRVVEGCVAGMHDLAYERAGVLAAELPDAARADVGP
jgi:hypothetical protein